MKTNFRQTIGQITITCFALLTLALPKQARAQFTGNNQTNIISGMTSNWPGFYYVGSNYVFDALFIKNNGVLSNGACVIGGSVGANSNLAVVSGSGSVWNNTNFVAVGSPGAGNRLVISNGGKVIVTGAFGGPPTVSSVVGLRNLGPTSNNAALVTGTGSLWSNRYDLRVGFSGLDLTSDYSASNSMIISDGGAVIDSSGYIGYVGNNLSHASNNSVLVTGSGSVWNNSSNLFIGDHGGGANSLVISNGGTVLDGNGYLGGAPGSANNNNNNRALVTGTGSIWSNSVGLYVGSRGNGNSLMISNGGMVLGDGQDSLAGSYLGGGNSNSICVTGNDSLWSTRLQLSISGKANSLVVGNGGKVISSSGVVGGSGSNIVLVTGSGSVWSNNALSIGVSGAGNTMVISNGGAVFNQSYSANAYIGGGSFFGSSSNHTVVVTGSGSVWNNNGELFVGLSGSSNRLVIRDGGAVVSGAGWIGYCDTPGGCDNNSVLVTDPGSVWTNKCANGYCGLFVGAYGGRGSSLVISNGGRVVSMYRSEASSKSSVLVTGDGSAWTVAGLLYIAGTVTLNGGTISANSLVLHETLGKLTFNRGLLNSASTGVTNAQQFVVGDGTNSATFHLLGGEHSFTDGLRIRTNSFLIGCGTINGRVLVEAGGTVQADCGTNLIFTGNVTNNGVMMVSNGNVLESSGTLVNNGTILLLDTSTPNFHGTFINNGVVLKPEIHLAIERDSSGGLFLRFTGAPDVTYRLQRTASLTGTWTNFATNTAPASGLIEYHGTSPLPGQGFYRTVQP